MEASASQAPADWTEVTATLPEGTKYFALQVTGRQKFMLMIDDFTYSLFNTSDLRLLGYNLYWAGERINDQLITQPGFVGDWYGEGDYQVTAVYEQGESRLSEPFTIGTDGIGQIENGELKKEDSSVYDLLGRKIVNRQSVNGKLPKGVYIQNGKKIVVP